MKISLFLLGVVFSIFFISMQDVYSMNRKHAGQKAQTSRSTKCKKTDTQQAVPTQEEDADLDESLQDTNAYIKKVKPIRIRVLFFEAENRFHTNEFEAALPIYEKIVNESNDPLALFRLGEIYEKMAEANEDPNFLTKSYECYKLALGYGFTLALPKLLELGEALNQFVKASQSKPMSVEIQQMYS